ncbi:ABC transporter permease [Pedococcus sp. KACC 23699]|uniref:ABC transporter permease n=1 Tax=Pedococcus sp. KACC 23699 TaxID=3149228 RepID=A0AAU7JUW1_9MICO
MSTQATTRTAREGTGDAVPGARPETSGQGARSIPSLPRIVGPRPTTAVPFARLVLVELRKQLDTRAGRWLLVTIGLVVAVIVTIMLFVGGGAHGYEGYFGATSLPLMLLVPIVGILAATAEWSQRTGLTTFALEPRRHRVVLAKVVASLGAAAASFVTALGLAAVANLIAVQVRGADSPWQLSAGMLWGVALVLVLSLAQGVGFGLSLLNTPAAIVAYLVLPTVWSIVTGLVEQMRTVGQWLDIGSATEPLLEGAAMQARDWAQVGTSSLLWVVLPLAIGLWRVRRSEVK